MTTQPSGDVVRLRPLAPKFGTQETRSAQNDPLMPTELALTLDQIKPYDRNPRRSPHAKFDLLKDQIKAARGIKTQLTVTRRPGDPLYMPEDGGNTRLKVLNELWTATRDPVFYHIVVKFIPWVSESSVLANHLIENIARADMTFHDQAVGFYELRREWERERNEPITDIGFLSMLKDRGLDEVSRTDFVRMRFVVEHLLHALPDALEAGLGPRYIDNIKAYHRLYKEYWQSKKKREDAFTVLFQEALTSLDDPEFAIGMIPKMVESRISAQLGIPLTQVRLEIDLIRSAALAGRLPDHPPTSSTATLPVATTSPKSNSTRAYGPADHNRTIAKNG